MIIELIESYKYNVHKAITKKLRNIVDSFIDWYEGYYYILVMVNHHQYIYTQHDLNSFRPADAVKKSEIATWRSKRMVENVVKTTELYAKMAKLDTSLEVRDIREDYKDDIRTDSGIN